MPNRCCCLSDLATDAAWRTAWKWPRASASRASYSRRALGGASDPSAPAAAVNAAKDRFGRIDVLVNNAGYGYQSSVEEGEEEAIRAQFDANTFGLFALTANGVRPITDV